MITIFVKYTVNLLIQFVCEFALENAGIAVLELQKWNNFLGEDPNPRFLLKLSMTVQVNHKKLYYNYYTLGKYLLKILISSKILLQPPPPQLQMLCCVPVD
jgi:hypothetical protein